jgi:hypothetical protein
MPSKIVKLKTSSKRASRPDAMAPMEEYIAPVIQVDRVDPEVIASETEPGQSSFRNRLSKIRLRRSKSDGSRKYHPKNKLLLGLMIGLALFSVVFLIGTIFLVVIPAQQAYTAVQSIGDKVNALAADLGNKDLTRLDAYVTEINAEFDKIVEIVNRYEFLNELGFTKGYYHNLQVAGEIIDKSQILLTETVPEFKVILQSVGYRVDPNEPLPAEGVEGTEAAEGEEENSLNGLLKEMPRIIQLYESSEPQIFDLIETFNKIDPEYIPSIGSGSWRQRVVDLQALTADVPSISAQVKEVLALLPELLGAESPTTYLVIFQNEKEMRASGGLLTAFGTVTVDKGDIGDEISATDMWDLEGFVRETLGVNAGPASFNPYEVNPEYVNPYWGFYQNIYGQNFLMNNGCGATALRAQDSGLYPDLYWTMDIFSDYYDVASLYNPVKYPAYDHILILNTFFASDIVSLVEPLTIESNGAQITSENLAREIFAETSTAPLDPSIRKSYIGEVASAVQDKITSLSAEQFMSLGQMLIRTIQAKNIAFSSKDEQVQAYFDELGLSGRIEKNFAGDYFHLNEAQNCALKSNFYVRNTTTQTVNIDAEGDISKVIRVDWKNDHVIQPGEENIISSSWAFFYRAWVRVFAPEGSAFTGSDGLGRSGPLWYEPFDYYDSTMEKQMQDNIIYFDQRRFTDADPIPEQQLIVTYDLPQSLKYDPLNGYRLLIQKHPGKQDEQNTVNINDNGTITSITFTLDRDKVVTYQSGIVRVEDFDVRLDTYYELLETLKGV